MVKAGLFKEIDSALSDDKDLWLKQAFKNYQKEGFKKRKVVGALLADSFATSNWYQYYLTVMWYKERFFAVCKEQGLAIPRYQPGHLSDPIHYLLRSFCLYQCKRSRRLRQPLVFVKQLFGLNIYDIGKISEILRYANYSMFRIS